jgi:hypothetical protein
MNVGGPTREDAPPDTSARTLVIGGLRRGALLVFLPVFAAAQALAWLTYAVTGWFRPWSWFKIGNAVALTGTRVGFDVTVALRDLASGSSGTAASELVVATGALTIAVLVLAYRAGREQARGLERRPQAAAAAGAIVGIGFGVLSFVTALPVSLVLPRLGIEELRPMWWQALVMPVAVASVAGAFGGLARARERLDASGAAWVVAAIRGGAGAFWWGSSLAFVGLLIAAVLSPSPVGAYARFVDRTGGGAALVVEHATLVPNQSVLVLGASMGAPTTLRVGTQDVLEISRGGVDAAGPAGPFVAAILGSPDQHLAEFPWWFTAFLLVPAAAAVIGGREAGRDASERKERLLRGAGAGIVYAACCTVAVWASSITLPGIGVGLAQFGAGPIRLGASPVGTGALALAWGVVGCSVGALVPWPARFSAVPKRPR